MVGLDTLYIDRAKSFRKTTKAFDHSFQDRQAVHGRRHWYPLSWAGRNEGQRLFIDGPAEKVLGFSIKRIILTHVS